MDAPTSCGIMTLSRCPDEGNTDMKNITVSVDDETYRLSRGRAARVGTSVSTLMRDYLKSFVRENTGERDGNGRSEETECEGSCDVFADFDARGVELRMADNFPREVLYDRDAPR